MINYTQGKDVRVGRTNKHPAVEHPGHRDVPGDHAEYKYSMARGHVQADHPVSRNSRGT
jgi:hypothetical protein